MRKILVAVAILLVFLAFRELCMLKKNPPRKRLNSEAYAPQVMHGVAGGIAGPILNHSLYEYDAPRYPLPNERKAIIDEEIRNLLQEPHVLWSTPPEPPA